MKNLLSALELKSYTLRLRMLAWDESKRTRGKTSDKSRGGSFAPSGVVDAAKNKLWRDKRAAMPAMHHPEYNKARAAGLVEEGASIGIGDHVMVKSSGEVGQVKGWTIDKNKQGLGGSPPGALSKFPFAGAKVVGVRVHFDSSNKTVDIPRDGLGKMKQAPDKLSSEIARHEKRLGRKLTPYEKEGLTSAMKAPWNQKYR